MAPPITFVLAIESGPLEPASVLYARSLRKFGGRFADAPILAIQPRVGPRIAKETERQLAEVGVRYLYRPQRKTYNWYVFMSKPYAFEIAEREADTDLIAFTDHDILVAHEPEALELPDGVDFAACPSDKNIGSTGPGDEHEGFWVALLKALKIDPDAYPWITEYRDNQRIRLYINSGVFVARKSAGLAKPWIDLLGEMIETKVAHHGIGIGPYEQMAFGPLIHRLGLAWQPLPLTYNMNFQKNHQDYERSDFPDARMIHYHRTLQKHWNWSVDLLRTTHPALGEWLAKQTPLDDGPRPLTTRAQRFLLARLRRAKMRRHLARVTRY